MHVLLAVLIVALIVGVVAIVTAPLRRERAARAPAGAAQPPAAIADLEAAREAKYREIRDAELDFRTGKLSAADFEAVDAQLRAEALAILDRLERERARSVAAPDGPS